MKFITFIYIPATTATAFHNVVVISKYDVRTIPSYKMLKKETNTFDDYCGLNILKCVQSSKVSTCVRQHRYIST